MAKKLKDLPASDDKYFTKYEAKVTQTEDKKPKKCKHYFIRRRALEAECQNCHMGLYLEIQDSIKDGHIYRKDKLII
jgi:hypothetical protein